MAALIKLIVGAAIEALIKQIPTIVSWWEKRQALKSAAAQHEKNASDIDRALLDELRDGDNSAGSPRPGATPAPAPAVSGGEKGGS